MLPRKIESSPVGESSCNKSLFVFFEVPLTVIDSKFLCVLCVLCGFAALRLCGENGVYGCAQIKRRVVLA
jgi:hypothetical protein